MPQTLACGIVLSTAQSLIAGWVFLIHVDEIELASIDFYQVTDKKKINQ
jgi:hypothetical protein